MMDMMNNGWCNAITLMVVGVSVYVFAFVSRSSFGRLASIAARVSYLSVIISVLHWLKTDYRGFQSHEIHDPITGKTDHIISFSYHPFFNLLAFLVFTTEALMMYRAFPNRMMPYKHAKALHFSCHLLTILFSGLAFGIAVYNKERKGLTHMFSAHSWLGFLTVSLHISQFIPGLYVFYNKDQALKRWLVPIHTFFGVVIHLSACLTITLGLLKLQPPDDGPRSSSMLLGNRTILGVWATALFATMAVTTHYHELPTSQHIFLEKEALLEKEMHLEKGHLSPPVPVQ